jgi:predicted nucleic acid-binding protein
VSRTIFLDSSGWFAAIAPRDALHRKARALYGDATRAGAAFLSTALVVAEVHALVLRDRGPDGGRKFLAAAFDTPSHHIVAGDPELLRAAVDEWIGGFADQSFSLCDAVSFEVMRREGLTHALAFDRHFEVAGFQLLR